MYAIRIIYPKRRGRAGKRDLVKQVRTMREAEVYANKVVNRKDVTHRPIACIFSLKSWDMKPKCWRLAKAGSTRTGETRRGSWRIQRVPYTALGRYRRRG